MKVFAASDLHLSFAGPVDLMALDQVPMYKPMDVFGPHWQNCYQKIYDHWNDMVSEEDWVLMPGDLSWAMTLEECRYDFDFISRLKGKIILIRGNHDYWWQGIGKVKKALPANVYALQHDSLVVGSKVVCGSRGWILPGSNEWTEADNRIYLRELLRLEMSLLEAKKASLPIIVMMHYMPALRPDQPSGFTQLMQQYQVDSCIYGHLHGDAASRKIEGEYWGIRFYNASIDLLDFQPKIIWQE